jgi:hypothetical protein
MYVSKSVASTAYYADRQSERDVCINSPLPAPHASRTREEREGGREGEGITYNRRDEEEDCKTVEHRQHLIVFCTSSRRYEEEEEEELNVKKFIRVCVCVCVCVCVYVDFVNTH